MALRSLYPGVIRPPKPGGDRSQNCTGLVHRGARARYTHSSGPSVYTRRMRRINIYIDDELDRRAQLEARKRRISKAALIRAGLIAEIGLEDSAADAIDELVGLSDAAPSADIDAVIYGA